MTPVKTFMISLIVIISFSVSSGFCETPLTGQTQAKPAAAKEKKAKDKKTVTKAKNKKTEKPAVSASTQTAQAAWGTAPDFSAKRMDDTDFTLSSMKGKVILLNFWATWCPYCRKEIPDLIQLTKTYKKAEFEVVGVAFERDSVTVKEFAMKKGINYLVVTGDNQIAQQYGISGIPATCIIDKNGNLVKKYVGTVELETVDEVIKKLLAN